jgi:hypothetical protein
LSKIRAVTALSMARLMLPISAPSWRTNASRWPQKPVERRTIDQPHQEAKTLIRFPAEKA